MNAIDSEPWCASSTGTGRACPTTGGRSSPPARRSGALLDADEQDRLGELADHVLRTKRWEAAKGQELTDEVRTVVAGHAALLVLGLDESAYDGVGTIVVRSRAMRRAAPMAGPAHGRADGRARRRRRRGPPRRRPDHARVAVGPARGRATRASAATSCSTSSATSSTCSTARSTARRRSPTTPLAPALGRGVHRRVPGRARRRRRAPLRSVRRHEPGRVLRRRHRDVLHPPPRSSREAKPALYDVLAAYYRQDPAAADRTALPPGRARSRRRRSGAGRRRSQPDGLGVGRGSGRTRRRGHAAAPAAS